MTLPRIRILATGGTIAGSASSATDATGYRAGTASVDELIASVPALRELADLSGEQFGQLDSSDLTDALLLDLARRVQQLVDDPWVDGVVVTHGTDTLEETAYLLHLVLSTEKPVVLVGAMRPATALSADGPRNLFAAVTVAVSPATLGRGVLVVLDDEVHTARDVTKTTSLGVHAFASPYGPLGVVTDGRVAFYRSVDRPHTARTEFGIPEALPRSAVLFAHTGLDAASVEALDGVDVIVHAGFGNGTVSARLVDALDAARARGALVVRASRVGSGTLTVVGASADAANRWVAADDQNPQRARLLGALALTVTRDPAEVQRIFHTY
ncbi:asparaginase [Galbitalea sp. SE-J8]|uniref:asparaginase n=1 Tax=Galbitalea sp. SE-J8 TaxID=3054952 RepID=UPI00259CDB66|nr:asparaginase [Galbitalea sp. SE-J8]MDM4764075.1 asparaginase [Galbitalea sp. SE-J8]